MAAVVDHHGSAVAQILGVKISGWLAWFLWRCIYLAKIPGVASITAGGPYRPYDRGGWLMPGGKAVNLSGRPEYVLNPDQTAAGAGGNTYIINAPLGGITAEVVAEIQRKADWHSRTGHFS